jgi:bifunctional DNA-binding transcriptional regulator/antitoxin component of YhaV-PrlF toxin-antitoxin module
MLQSCIWHHYGYWFDTISEDFDQKIGKAINSFLGWQPTAEMPLESSNRSSEALVEVIEEIKDFVRVTMQVLDRLIAPTFRKPVELALEAKMSSQSTLVTGPELLARVKELGDASKSDLVRAAGYISTKKDGTERLNFTAFYEALLEANGVSLGEGRAKDGGAPGRKLSYIVTVQSNGNLLIGKAYTAQLGLQPGDEFEIRIGKKEIHLVPVARKHPAGVPAVSTEFHASTSVSTKR